jgi:putative endonuclease
MGMIRVFTSKTQQIGQLGEDLAVKYLENKDFSIIERNYTLKQGEIDIIAKKDEILYFFEVKASLFKNSVSYETYNPAENMHPKKIEKFVRTANLYVMNNQVSREIRVVLLSVIINQQEKTAKIEMIDF